MMLELAIGDAYGAGFEFRNRAYVKAFNRVDHYGRQPLSIRRSGRYTDDTQMTVAVAEVLVAGEEWTPLVLADSFIRAFKRDPRVGYAPRFHRFLQGVRDGEDFLARIRPTSERSGAAMRAGPIGLLASVDDVLERAEVQARITHDTTAGVTSAQAAALMVHHGAHDLGSPTELPAFVAEHVAGDWRTPWSGHVSIEGIPCVRAALTAVAECSSLAELLRRCVDWSGDVDTVATIALAAASCSKAYARDIPDRLVDNLERGPFGHDFLVGLDAELDAFRSRSRG